MRFMPLAAGLAATVISTAALAQPAPAPAAQPDHYSTATTPIGALLDDPAAKAVLLKYIPDTVNSPQVDAARSMTLKDIEQYAPATITDDVLAKMDADLAKLPAKP